MVMETGVGSPCIDLRSVYCSFLEVIGIGTGVIAHAYFAKATAFDPILVPVPVDTCLKAGVKMRWVREGK